MFPEETLVTKDSKSSASKERTSSRSWASDRPIKASLGFYVGGMGAKGQNYHTKLMARMGFEEEALHVQELFLEGRRDEAIAAVPDEFADEISLVGTAARIRDRLAAFEDSPVTMLNVAPRSAEQLRRTAELLLE